ERQRCELLLKLGEAQWSAGLEKPQQSMREATKIAERLGNPELFARAALAAAGPFIGMTLMGLEDEQGIALLERALASLADRDSALRAQVMATLASVLTIMEQPQAAGSLARAAIEMARRVGDRGALAYVLDAAPWATWGPDNLDERLALAEEL